MPALLRTSHRVSEKLSPSYRDGLLLPGPAPYRAHQALCARAHPSVHILQTSIPGGYYHHYHIAPVYPAVSALLLSRLPCRLSFGAWLHPCCISALSPPAVVPALAAVSVRHHRHVSLPMHPPGG